MGEFEITNCDLKRAWRRRTSPYAFTEQGVAILSSVPRRKQAVQVNIEIMRAFVKPRTLSVDHKALARRLNQAEARYDKQFAVVFDAISMTNFFGSRPVGHQWLMH